jgi:hypothetical protein
MSWMLAMLPEMPFACRAGTRFYTIYAPEQGVDSDQQMHMSNGSVAWHHAEKHAALRQVRNLGKPVALAGRYFEEGADEISFLNITGFRDFPLGDLPMLQVRRL